MSNNHKLEAYLGSENYVEKMSKWDFENKNKKAITTSSAHFKVYFPEEKNSFQPIRYLIDLRKMSWNIICWQPSRKLL